MKHKGYEKVKFGYRQIANTGIGDIKIQRLKVSIATKPFKHEDFIFKNISERDKFIKEQMKKYSNIRRKIEPFTILDK